MTWTPTGAGSYIKFSGAADAEKNNLIDSAKSGTPTFASGDVTVPVNTGAVVTNLFRNTTAATFYDGDVTDVDVVDNAGIQGGDYLQGDATSLYCEFPTLAIATGETVAFDFKQLNGDTLNLDGSSPRLVLYWSSVGRNSFAPSNITITTDGVNGKGQTATVGDVHNCLVTVTSSTYNLSRVHRNHASNYSGGIVANLIITQAAGTTIYKMDNVTDNGDGTGTVPNTGTNTSQGDMTIYNFVAATDIVTVPNNTFSYDLSEGAGTTLGSTPSGKNVSLVNSPTWS
jgi:hypothetical protein